MTKPRLVLAIGLAVAVAVNVIAIAIVSKKPPSHRRPYRFEAACFWAMGCRRV
jgi:hypothetical protein